MRRGFTGGDQRSPRCVARAAWRRAAGTLSIVATASAALGAVRYRAGRAAPPRRLETAAQFGLLATAGNTSTRSLWRR